MINRILIHGDNSDLLSAIMSSISDFMPSPSVHIATSAFPPLAESQSDIAYIYISSDSQVTTSMIENTRPSQVAYVTCQADKKIAENLENYEVLGYQRHLKKNTDSAAKLNLGNIRNNISICEPTIRDSDLFLLDLDVLRKSEVQNAAFSHPSGLFSEDVTQMCRYAGMSEVTRYFVVNNATESNTDLIAQLIWYFAEAASIRFPDHPYFANTVEEYAVEVTSFNTTLSFYKSKTSGRWWVKIPEIPENKWKSCSYKDYQDACNDNISGQLLNSIAVSE